MVPTKKTASRWLPSQNAGDGKCSGNREAGCARHDAHGARPWGEARDPVAHGVAGGDVPRFIDIDLGHHAFGEERRCRQAGQVFDRFHHPAPGFDLRATGRTLPDVRFERRDAKSNLAVEQLVDLVREQVAVCHSV